MTKTKTAKAPSTVPVDSPAPDILPSDLPVPAPRDDKGRFPAGVSGNPAGRAKGTKNRITLERLLLEEKLRGALSEEGPKIMKKAIKMALEGNDKVMRVLLDKMLATPKGDDSDNAPDRDIKILVQNLTSQAPDRPALEGTVVQTQITKETHREQREQSVPDGSGTDGNGKVQRT